MIRTVRVGDVLRLERRPVVVDPLGTYEEIGVRSFGKGIFHKEPVTGAELGGKRVFEIHPGDLVLSNVFAWEGAVALARESETGRIGSHRFMTYVAASEDVDLGYLRYFFISEAGLAFVNRASPGSAGRNKTLAIDRFEALEIPLPPLEQQRRVATTLDAMGSIFERCTLLQQQAVRMATVLREAFVDPHAPRVALGAVLCRGGEDVRVDPAASYRVAGVLSFGRGLYARPPILGSETQYRTLTRLHEGQLVMARLSAWEGGLAVVPADYAGMFVSQEFPVFEYNRGLLHPGYLELLCQWRRLWDLIMDRSRGIGARTGARRLRAHADHLLEIGVPLPGMDVQSRLAKLGSMLSRTTLRMENRKGHMEALRVSILNRAFAGLL